MKAAPLGLRASWYIALVLTLLVAPTFPPFLSAGFVALLVCSLLFRRRLRRVAIAFPYVVIGTIVLFMALVALLVA